MTIEAGDQITKPRRKVLARGWKDRWTEEEARLLEDGVLLFGRNWERIKHEFRMFQNKTVTSLRDKWQVIIMRQSVSNITDAFKHMDSALSHMMENQRSDRGLVFSEIIQMRQEMLAMEGYMKGVKLRMDFIEANQRKLFNLMRALVYNNSEAASDLKTGFQSFNPSYTQKIIDENPSGLVIPSFRHHRNVSTNDYYGEHKPYEANSLTRKGSGWLRGSWRIDDPRVEEYYASRKLEASEPPSNEGVEMRKEKKELRKATNAAGLSRTLPDQASVGNSDCQEMSGIEENEEDENVLVMDRLRHGRYIKAKRNKLIANQVTPFECGICRQGYMSLNYLRSHLKAVHGVRITTKVPVPMYKIAAA
mmetsp:Transcript_4574/g.10771  ORF Transcript_4574/g.10771 Transcript_4574/m.10771 type:complete len:363 (+) Transcript_4574:236-1324(+)